MVEKTYYITIMREDAERELKVLTNTKGKARNVKMVFEANGYTVDVSGESKPRPVKFRNLD